MGNRIYIIGNPSSEQSCTLSYSCEIIVKYRVIPVYPELVSLIGATVPNYQGVFLRGYGGQTSYHYGAVGHWSAGLGELQGDGIREISASFSTGGQHGIKRVSGSFGVTGGQGYDWKYGGTGNNYWGWNRFLCFSHYSGCR